MGGLCEFNFFRGSYEALSKNKSGRPELLALREDIYFFQRFNFFAFDMFRDLFRMPRVLNLRCCDVTLYFQGLSIKNSTIYG
jgi:hypothetical protein